MRDPIWYVSLVFGGILVAVVCSCIIAWMVDSYYQEVDRLRRERRGDQ